MKDDPAIDEFRDAKPRISERVNHDLQQLVAYDIQEKYRDRLISRLVNGSKNRY